MKKLTTQDYQAIATEMKRHRKIKRHNKKDVDNILIAFHKGDWEAVHASKLYNNNGGHYCSLLQVLCNLGYTR